MKLLLDQLKPVVLNVGLAVHNADWNWKNVNSPFMRIYYVTKGFAQIELPDGIYQLKVGHMYLIPSFQRSFYPSFQAKCRYNAYTIY